MHDGEIIETDKFCLHCGNRVMVECRYEEGSFFVFCPECQSQRDEFSREEEKVYEQALEDWFDIRKENYYEEKGEDAHLAARNRRLG